MMTPPSGWHPDGSMGPYSNDDSLFSDFKKAIWKITKVVLKTFYGIDLDHKESPVSPNEGDCAIFVFGPIGAGKTTFLKRLGANVNTAGYGTAEEKYPSFSTKVGEKMISVKEGIDIGGDKRYLANGTIEKMLKEKDKVIFVFAATSFLDKKNNHYRGEIMSRLNALYDVPAFRNKISIIASRLDECKSDRQIVINEIRKEFVDKYYRDILNDSFGVFNLTDEKDIELIKQMIFK